MSTLAYENGGLVIPAQQPTKTFASRLRQSLEEFEAQLADTENFQIIAMIGGRAFTVEHIGIRGSEIAVIDGPADEPGRYRILCHVHALQLMLKVFPKQPNEKRRRIGFLWPEDAEAAEKTSGGDEGGAPIDEAGAPEGPADAVAKPPSSY